MRLGYTICSGSRGENCIYTARMPRHVLYFMLMLIVMLDDGVLSVRIFVSCK